jgi:hypothetical protein
MTSAGFLVRANAAAGAQEAKDSSKHTKHDAVDRVQWIARPAPRLTGWQVLLDNSHSTSAAYPLLAASGGILLTSP